MIVPVLELPQEFQSSSPEKRNPPEKAGFCEEYGLIRNAVAANNS
jgi:hypothetical protein